MVRQLGDENKKNIFFAFSCGILSAQSSLNVKLIFKEKIVMRETIKQLVFVFCIFFWGGLECVGPTFAYVAHLVFLRDAWIRTQRAAILSICATNLAILSKSPVPKSPTQIGFDGARKRRMKTLHLGSFKGTVS
jgi:hypothetical protein